MMSGVVRSREAERLAKHRRVFEFAVEAGVSLAEAKRRIGEADWRAARERFERRRLGADGLTPRHDVPAAGRPWMMAE